MVTKLNLRLSTVAVDEIIAAIEQSAKRWKKGMDPKTCPIPFQEDVILAIKRQAREQGITGDKFR